MFFSYKSGQKGVTQGGNRGESPCSFKDVSFELQSEQADIAQVQKHCPHWGENEIGSLLSRSSNSTSELIEVIVAATALSKDLIAGDFYTIAIAQRSSLKRFNLLLQRSWDETWPLELEKLQKCFDACDRNYPLANLLDQLKLFPCHIDLLPEVLKQARHSLVLKEAFEQALRYLQLWPAKRLA